MADVYQNWILYNVGKAIKNGNEYSFDWTMLNEYNQLQQQYSDYQSSIDGIQANLKTSIENKWVEVPTNATLAQYPSYIDQIKTIEDTPAGITWSQLYWWTYSVWKYQDIGSLDWCVSYATDDLVLIWYMWNWQTYDNYDQKDIHFLRWKKWVSSRQSSSLDMGTWTTYSFFNEWMYITKENDWASYLFTAKARYSTDGTSDWRYRGQIRYTVSSDTFTNLGTTNTSSVTDPWPDIVDDDMMLYTSSYETSGQTRVALFTLKNA